MPCRPADTGPALALLVTTGLIVLGVRLFDRGHVGSGIAAVFAGVVGWVCVLAAVWCRPGSDRDDAGPGEHG
jgi:hypothetical protein